MVQEQGEGVYQLNLAIENTGVHSFVFSGTQMFERLRPHFSKAAAAQDRPTRLIDAQLAPIQPPYLPGELMEWLYRELSPGSYDAYRSLLVLSEELERELANDPNPRLLQFSAVALGMEESEYLICKLMSFPSTCPEKLWMFSRMVRSVIEQEVSDWQFRDVSPPETALPFEEVAPHVTEFIRTQLDGRPAVLLSAIEDLLRPIVHAKALSDQVQPSSSLPKVRL